MKLYTIEEVANLLKVSNDTVRRRIRRGELIADKQIGPYGEQWMLPASQFNEAVQDIPVQRVTRQVGVGEIETVITQTVAEAVQRETQPLKEEIAALKVLNENLLAGLEKVIASQTLSVARGELISSNIDKSATEIISAVMSQSEKADTNMKEIEQRLSQSDTIGREHFRLLDEKIREVQLIRQQEAQNDQQKDSFWQRLLRSVKGE